MHTETEFHLDQCTQILTKALHDLDVTAAQSTVSEIANLIIQAMSGPWRQYHTPQHVFDVCNSSDPIEVLAALFHDVVYVQVDGHIHLNVLYYLVPYIRQEGRKIIIRHPLDMPKSLDAEVVMSIFGVMPGQTLPCQSGQNEFLSALVAARVLRPLLPLDIIAQVVTCIEATIPFRLPEAKGVSPIESLHQRLLKTCDRFSLGLSPQDIHHALLRAVRLANRDVSGFATASPGEFLDNTWRLLPESNHALKNNFSYTVRDYRTALQKMEIFLNYLSPSVIFHQFHEEPGPQTYQAWIEAAQYNLAVGRLYTGSKLLTIAILEALATRYSIDTQLSTLMGDLPSKQNRPPRLSDFLPKVAEPYRPCTDVERDVMAFLEFGRKRDIDYDIPNSPLSSFLVQELGFNEIKQQLVEAKRFFHGELSPEQFLAGFRSDVIAVITYAIFELLKTRLRSLVFSCIPAPKV